MLIITKISFISELTIKAKNFRLMVVSVVNPKKEEWQELIAHRDDVLLEGFDLFQDHLRC